MADDWVKLLNASVPRLAEIKIKEMLEATKYYAAVFESLKRRRKTVTTFKRRKSRKA